MGDKVLGEVKRGESPSFDIGGPTHSETSTPWGVTLKPVRRISKVVVEDEDSGQLGKPIWEGMPQIRVDEDEKQRMQSNATTKIQPVMVPEGGEKVKS